MKEEGWMNEWWEGGLKDEKGGGLKIEGVTGKMYKLKKTRSPVFKKN